MVTRIRLENLASPQHALHLGVTAEDEWRVILLRRGEQVRTLPYPSPLHGFLVMIRLAVAIDPEAIADLLLHLP